MFGIKEISLWQFAFFRIALGLYLLIHFAQLTPYAEELFSASGVLSDPQLSPLYRILPSPFWISDTRWMALALTITACISAVLLTIGYWRKTAAAVLALIWAWLFCRNPLIANPSLGYVGLVLVLTLLIPNTEALRLSRSQKKGEWFYPRSIYGVAWLLLAVGYTFSGLIKLQSPSWIDGSALYHLATNPLARPSFLRDMLLDLPGIILKGMTWAALAGEILFLPLSFNRRLRFYLWSFLLIMHAGILIFVDFLDLTLGMFLIHLFVFDPDWMKPNPKEKKRTLFFDGECGLCTESVKFLMSADRSEILTFAPLQGETSSMCLPPDLRDTKDLSTVVYQTQTGDSTNTYLRSRAIVEALKDIGGEWRVIAYIMWLIPSPIRDVGYRLVAKYRLKLFPKGACGIPTVGERARLLP